DLDAPGAGERGDPGPEPVGLRDAGEDHAHVVVVGDAGESASDVGARDGGGRVPVQLAAAGGPREEVTDCDGVEALRAGCPAGSQPHGDLPGGGGDEPVRQVAVCVAQDARVGLDGAGGPAPQLQVGYVGVDQIGVKFCDGGHSWIL